MMLFRFNVFTFAVLHLLFVNGQNSWPVNVGLQGSFFDPARISAQVNDSVVFSFLGDIHTVTQSSFENPCTPLPGGFNSGLAGRGTNGSAPIPTWSLTITNVSGPIWFFCSATRPMPHCTSGMVGVINPPSISSYNDYVAAAKLVTGTAPPNFSVALTGQGAFATLPPSSSLVPATPPALITSSPTSSLPNSTSATSTPSQSDPASTNPSTSTSTTASHLGAIIGGGVGGGIALIGFIIILWLLCMRKKKEPLTSESDDFFRYNPVPVRRPSEVFIEAKRAEDLHHNVSIASHTTTHSAVISPTTPFSPIRRPPQSGPIRLQPPNLRRQISTQSDAPSSNLAHSTNGHAPLEQQPSNIDIRSLAQEVVAVLYQQPPTPPLPGHRKDSTSQELRAQTPMTVQNHDELERHGTQPPPNYRAATGPSSSVIPRGKVRNT